MKNWMSIIGITSLSLTTLIAIGKFATVLNTSAKVGSIVADSEVDTAKLANANVSLVIPGYVHCTSPIPDMRNIAQVTPEEGERKVFDSEGVEIGYVSPSSVFVITKPCGNEALSNNTEE